MLKRSWILVAILSVMSLVALPAAVYAHHEAQTCPDAEGDSDNRHPSGKDRHCESGNSGGATIQGTAESDPDDNGRGPDRSNGGADKPNGAGGLDHADQDSNNGCGNDDDFEDDNEGWCGGKPKPSAASARNSLGVNGDVGTSGKSARIAGESQVRGGLEENEGVEALVAPPGITEVLGESFSRLAPPTVVLGVEFVRGQVMAVTGGPLGMLAMLALTLIGTGGVLVRSTKKIAA